MEAQDPAAPFDQDQDQDQDQGPETPPGFRPVDSDPTEADKLTALLQSFRESAAGVEVFRYLKNGARQFVTRYTLPDFDILRVQEECGGGKYQFKLKGPGGEYLAAQTVEIWGAARDLDARPQEADLFKLVTESQKEVRALFDDMKAPPQAAQGQDWIRLSLALLGAVQAMQTPFLNALLARRESGPSPKDLMDMFVKGMETAQEMQPEPDPYGKVLTTFAPLLGHALHTPPPPPMAAQFPPAPQLPLPRTPADLTPRPAWDVALTPFLPMLARWAAQEKDAGARAALVVDDTPPEVLPLILEQVGRGEAFLQEFFTLHPEVRPWAGWYRAFWAALADMFLWDDDQEEADQVDAEKFHAPVEVAPPPPDTQPRKGKR